MYGKCFWRGKTWSASMRDGSLMHLWGQEHISDVRGCRQWQSPSSGCGSGARAMAEVLVRAGFLQLGWGGGTGVSPVVSMCVTHAPAEDPGWLMCRSMLSPKRPAWPWWCQGMCCSAEPHPICTAPVGIGETELGFSEGLIHSCSCLLLGSSICPCSQAPPSSTGWAERHKTSTVP